MWTLTPQERMRFWLDFRKSISEIPIADAIEKTNHLWSYAPFLRYYLTTDDISKWPTPWELIYENEYCDLARALGIVYTLWLSIIKILSKTI